ncbi:carbohydrate-binding family 9-like protein [Fulvivirga sedimenti]|uniref:Carbohydrate-binding family 9-like protein n=1 Tax=Fulvivirga sedimenti TaxID=2879465 RepID=A0A9X1HTE0_9BACT|nr:carbohydrate-binding family 9-like protein [Fulvivirga sedimenti]MCA6074640.1 carbohydrate-binding family 9-like protein [Fulvivirga sedimenti]MCA6075817.1 carbohydrate-binding family 9-like protein [Fulvivirga sedimenti]MCA6076945.1 carbohydrate-binding family 9-like protein [Fulvivirga sedimenti]
MKILCTLTLILFSIVATSQENPMTIHRTSDFEITGHGSAGEWGKADWFEIPQRTGNGEKMRTQAKVLYSDQGMYFLVECEDRKLTSSLTEDNTDLYNEDVVEVFLWTDEEHPLYFEYEISPLNYELVLIIPNFDGDFLGWIPWHYEGGRRIKHQTSVKGGEKKSMASVESWTAEFFIPYELLKPLRNVPPSSGMEWRMNIYRMDYDSGMRDRWEWKPIVKNFHEYKLFGRVRFE